MIIHINSGAMSKDSVSFCFVDTTFLDAIVTGSEEQVIFSPSMPDIVAFGIQCLLESTRRISAVDSRNDELLLISQTHCVRYLLSCENRLFNSFLSNTTLIKRPVLETLVQNGAVGCSGYKMKSIFEKQNEQDLKLTLMGNVESILLHKEVNYKQYSLPKYVSNYVNGRLCSILYQIQVFLT